MVFQAFLQLIGIREGIRLADGELFFKAFAQERVCRQQVFELLRRVRQMCKRDRDRIESVFLVRGLFPDVPERGID